jgi:hypothetical protein
MIERARPATSAANDLPVEPAGYPPLETRILLRIEGGVAAAVAVYLFSTLDVSWWLFALLILAPDLSALGFLASPRIGVRTYNFAHLWVWPVLLGLVGYLIYTADTGGSPILLGVALIWAVHIGADRALGYGLKQSGTFEITHLGPIGRLRRAPRSARGAK